jgi:hypothetical protein
MSVSPWLGVDGSGLVDLESLQFEGEMEGAKLRRDLTADGGVAPVAGTAAGMRGAVAQLSGLEAGPCTHCLLRQIELVRTPRVQGGTRLLPWPLSPSLSLFSVDSSRFVPEPTRCCPTYNTAKMLMF